MKVISQIVAATVLLVFLGVSGVDCLVPNAQMSVAEKACCQRMAGQCDMSKAAEHPCCKKIAQHSGADADLNDLSHFPSSTLSLQVATLAPGLSPNVSMPSFAVLQHLGDPPHDPPAPSIEILRV
jgi:hypothetical protein